MASATTYQSFPVCHDLHATTAKASRKSDRKLSVSQPESRPAVHAAQFVQATPLYHSSIGHPTTMKSQCSAGPQARPSTMTAINAPQNVTRTATRPPYHTQPNAKSSTGIIHSQENRGIGGVATCLDYDMDDMVDFVSQMAQRMHQIFASDICMADIDLGRSVFYSRVVPMSNYFRSFVLQVLSSTRLPSSTILLGLLYMSKRISVMSYRGNPGHSKPDMYSMLTVGLALGSKFLDDNTFQNRSWSDVSHIRVADLNRLEYQWLADIKWNLHVDQEDPDGLQLWMQHWERFQGQRRDQSLLKSHERMRLDCSLSKSKYGYSQAAAALETKVDYAQPCCWDDDRFGYGQTGRDTPWSSHQPWRCFSPQSASDSCPKTPDDTTQFGIYNWSVQPRQHPFKFPSTCQIANSNAMPLGQSPFYIDSLDIRPDNLPLDRQSFDAHYAPPFMACA